TRQCVKRAAIGGCRASAIDGIQFTAKLRTEKSWIVVKFDAHFHRPGRVARFTQIIAKNAKIHIKACGLNGFAQIANGTVAGLISDRLVSVVCKNDEVISHAGVDIDVSKVHWWLGSANDWRLEDGIYNIGGAEYSGRADCDCANKDTGHTFNAQCFAV